MPRCLRSCLPRLSWQRSRRPQRGCRPRRRRRQIRRLRSLRYPSSRQSMLRWANSRPCSTSSLSSRNSPWTRRWKFRWNYLLCRLRPDATRRTSHAGKTTDLAANSTMPWRTRSPSARRRRSARSTSRSSMWRGCFSSTVARRTAEKNRACRLLVTSRLRSSSYRCRRRCSAMPFVLPRPAAALGSEPG